MYRYVGTEEDHDAYYICTKLCTGGELFGLLHISFCSMLCRTLQRPASYAHTHKHTHAHTQRTKTQM